MQDRPEDYDKARGRFIIDKEIMKLLPKDSRVLHPLPRVDEVRPSCACPSSVFHRLLYAHDGADKLTFCRSCQRWMMTHGQPTFARQKMACMSAWPCSNSV